MVPLMVVTSLCLGPPLVSCPSPGISLLGVLQVVPSLLLGPATRDQLLFSWGSLSWQSPPFSWGPSTVGGHLLSPWGLQVVTSTFLGSLSWGVFRWSVPSPGPWPLGRPGPSPAQYSCSPKSVAKSATGSPLQHRICAPYIHLPSLICRKCLS